VNWTPNVGTTRLANGITTGDGFGMVVVYTTNASGVPTLRLLSAGVGYEDGDVVTFAPPNGVGSPVSITIDLDGTFTLVISPCRLKITRVRGFLVAKVKNTDVDVTIGQNVIVRGGIVTITAMSDNSRHGR
jgi:hypothetical protein